MSVDMNAVVEARFEGKWVGFPLDASCDAVSSGAPLFVGLVDRPLPDYVSVGIPTDASDMTNLIYRMGGGEPVYHASLHNFRLLCAEYGSLSCFGVEQEEPWYGLCIGDLTKDLTHWRVVFWFN